jgi:hypothetical protein
MAENVAHRIASLVSLVVAVSVIAVGSVVASGPLSSGAATVVAANPATNDVGRVDRGSRCNRRAHHHGSSTRHLPGLTSADTDRGQLRWWSMRLLV